MIIALDIQNVTRMGPQAVPEVNTTIITARYIATSASTLSIVFIALIRILATLCDLKICGFRKILF
jgi:hypothetical protein